MNWRETLIDIFAGYVNQQTLEDGAEQMAFVSGDNVDYHNIFLEAIDQAIESLATDYESTSEIINTSGYKVSSSIEAFDLLHELRRLYFQKYLQAVQIEVRGDTPKPPSEGPHLTF